MLWLLFKAKYFFFDIWVVIKTLCYLYMLSLGLKSIYKYFLPILSHCAAAEDIFYKKNAFSIIFSISDTDSGSCILKYTSPWNAFLLHESCKLKYLIPSNLIEYLGLHNPESV